METQQEKDYRREKAVRDAVEAADTIILDASDGSTEETNWLTARLAEGFLLKALIPFHAAKLKKDQEGS